MPYHVEVVVPEDGKLHLNDLPFRAGELVEVTVELRKPPSRIENPYPLRGSVVRYDDPTEPVAADEWEARD